VASDPTVSRLIATLAGDANDALAAIAGARAAARERVWSWAGAPIQDGRVVLDLDATLVTAHSAKQDATRTWKKTFGFHPLLRYVDHGVGGAGEPVAALLRPGKAGSNTAVDHVQVLDAAPGPGPRRSPPDTPAWPRSPHPEPALLAPPTKTRSTGRTQGRRTPLLGPQRHHNEDHRPGEKITVRPFHVGSGAGAVAVPGGRSWSRCAWWFPTEAFFSVSVAGVLRFQLPPVEPCMRFSRTRLTDVVHRRHSVCPARPGRAWVRRRSHQD
jgi:Transposase DDE domain group 1